MFYTIMWTILTITVVIASIAVVIDVKYQEQGLILSNAINLLKCDVTRLEKKNCDIDLNVCQKSLLNMSTTTIMQNP